MAEKLGATPDIMTNNAVLMTLKKLEDTKKSEMMAIIQQSSNLQHISLSYWVGKKGMPEYT